MKPALHSVGTLEHCPLPGTGKYWGLRLGNWVKVQVAGLPNNGGTGRLNFAPIDRRGYPFTNGGALSCCEVFWGPVKNWGDVAPRIGRDRLQAAGASKFWLNKARKERVLSRKV